MRNMKFRAWDDHNMCWIPAGKLEEEVQINPIVRPDNTGAFEFYTIFGNGVEIVQYTGLKDKNGKQICKGDITRLTVLKTAHPNGLGIGEFKIEEVKFNPYSGFSGVGRIDRIERDIDSIEVIGNIYENPELLETP